MVSTHDRPTGAAGPKPPGRPARGAANGALDRPFTRRRFVAKGLAFVGLGAAMPAAFVRAAFAEGLPAGASGGLAATGRRMLVVVQLGGGNDGLNTLVPYASGAYYDARPGLAVPPERVLALDDRVGLHESLAALHPLYEAGQLAIVEGVGYPNPNRSHFTSMDIWHSAATNGGDGTGWLGRLLDHGTAEEGQLWRAANVGQALPLSLASEASFVPSLDSVPAYVLQTDPRFPREADRRVTDWARLYASQAAYGGRLALVSEAGLTAYESTLQLAEAVDAGSGASAAPAVDYPSSPLGQALSTTAQLLTSHLGTGVCYVTTGGFDTHAAQQGQQEELLAAVAEALAAFQADLDAQGIAGAVVTMVWTEFGRRFAENGSAGTDHGTAGPMFVLGERVRGGLHGEPPSLDRLDRGDLVHTTDFRSVYRMLIERHFEVDATAILGANYPELPIL